MKCSVVEIVTTTPHTRKGVADAWTMTDDAAAAITKVTTGKT